MPADADWIWKIDQEIPSRAEVACGLIRDFVEKLEDAGWNEALVFAIHMALEESIMNAIKHGNANDESKLVRIVAGFTASLFQATVTDEGEGFNPADVADPTLDENLEITSGRGVMLIRQFMDDVEYSQGGRKILMRKHRG